MQDAPPDLLKALQKAKSRYLARPDCTGVDLGYGYRDGLRTEELAIRIHFREKIPKKHLRAASLVPPRIDGVPTDVIQAVYRHLSAIAADPRRTGRAQRIQPGLSIGSFGQRVCPGTVAFRGFRPGLAEGVRGWVTLPRFPHLDARASGVEVAAEPIAGARGNPKSCPADCGP